MENELNYLSEKTESIDHQINMVNHGIKLGCNADSDLIDLEQEKEILENIINKLTQLEIS